MEKEIYIIRHGETDYNQRGIIQGRGVNSSINERGKLQAKAFFEHFGHLEFDMVFTSSLLRTQQTVQPFVDAGHQIDPHEDLDEIDWGIHEGKTPDTSLSEHYTFITNQWKAGVLDEKIPGGESPKELQLRQSRFIEQVLKKIDAKRILMCSHGRAMRSLLCTCLDINLSKMDDFPHQNLSLYKLAYKHETFNLEVFNYVDHVKEI